MQVTLPHVSQSSVKALIDQGLEIFIRNGEDVLLSVPEEEWNVQKEAYEASGKERITLRGVTLVKRQRFFEGHVDAPKQYSPLEGDMVPTGVDQNQCRICGYWMDDKMTPSDERAHDYQCYPHYKWVLREEAEAEDAAERKRREANQPPTFEAGEILIAKDRYPQTHTYIRIEVEDGKMVKFIPQGKSTSCGRETWVVRLYYRKITPDDIAHMSDEVRTWAGLSLPTP